MARPKKEEKKPARTQQRNTGNRSRNNDDNRERNPNRIGALWIKRKGNNVFMSGELEIDGEKIRILVFKNTYKETDNQPDYNILLPREESRRDSRNDNNDDDIPF